MTTLGGMDALQKPENVRAELSLAITDPAKLRSHATRHPSSYGRGLATDFNNPLCWSLLPNNRN
jgi:hypothetical protein